MSDLSKKIRDEFLSAIAKFLVGILLLASGAMLSLILGKEMREAIAHRIFVFFSATEQILTIIPRLIYLLASIILFVVSVILWNKLKEEHKPKDKLRTRYEYGNDEIIIFYQNPKLYSHLTPLEIVNDMEARVYCQVCNSELIFKNDHISCNCTHIHRSKGHILEAKEYAKRNLLELLKQDISK